MRRRRRLMRRVLLAGDLAAVAVACAIVELLGLESAGDTGGRLVGYAAATLTLVLLLAIANLYGRDEVRADHTTPDDLPALFQATTVAGFLGSALAWATGDAQEILPAVLIGWALLIVLLPLARAVTRALAHRHRGYVQDTVILGAGDVGQLIARKIMQHPEYGLRLIGFLDDRPRQRLRDLAHVPVLGGLRDVSRLVREQGVERVFVAFSGVQHTETLEVIRVLKDLDVQIDIVPRLFEVVGPNVGVTTIEGLPVIVLPPLRLSRTNLLIKRVLDIACAGFGLVVLSPLLALIALAIRLESRGPLVYAGERVGGDGRIFRQLKFRTMWPQYCDGPEYGGAAAEAAFARLLDREPALADEFARTQKLERDPRVTPFGRLLRRTSLDELPQLWNVLRGDLSLVGPRPITKRELRERYGARDGRGHAEDSFLIGYWDSPGLRPGLTGYWQISGRSRMSFDERIRLDTAYLTSWSLRLDLVILAKTFRALVPSRGAY